MINGTRRVIACGLVLALTYAANAADPANSDGTVSSHQVDSGETTTPAQAELMQGVIERQHQATIEKADSEHRAEMKKCEGLVWEEEKLCKDQVSTETAQTQAKAAKDREKRNPPE